MNDTLVPPPGHLLPVLTEVIAPIAAAHASTQPGIQPQLQHLLADQVRRALESRLSELTDLVVNDVLNALQGTGLGHQADAQLRQAVHEELDKLNG